MVFTGVIAPVVPLIVNTVHQRPVPAGALNDATAPVGLRTLARAAPGEGGGSPRVGGSGGGRGGGGGGGGGGGWLGRSPAGVGVFGLCPAGVGVFVPCTAGVGVFVATGVKVWAPGRGVGDAVGPAGL